MSTLARAIVSLPRVGIVSGVLAVALLAALTQLWFGNEVPDWMADKDFANYWTASRLALSGLTVDIFSGHDIYFAHMLRLFGPDYPWHSWSYPPHYLFFIWPLGLMDYAVAMIVFVAATLAAYLWAVRAFLGRLDLTKAMIMLLPFLLVNIWTAQNGFLTGALLLGGLALRHDRPILAGILFGCLTIKPQLGILIPFLLLMERQWLTIASAVATTVSLVVLSALVFGIDSWIGYVTATWPHQSAVMNHASGLSLAMIPSVFGSLRVLGFEATTALIVHILLALPVLAWAGWAMLRSVDPLRRASILVLATMVVTPYWLIYDFGAAAAALLACRQLAETNSNGAQAGAIFFAAGLVPLMATPFGLASLPFAPILLWAALALAIIRCDNRPAREGSARQLRSPAAASD